MKTEQLRSGNFVLISGAESNVNNYTLLGIKKGIFSQLIEPIELDTQWLEYFGFKYWCGIWEKEGIKIEEVDDSFFVLESDGNYIGNKFNHVYKLQNIYFALKDEEL